MKKKIWIGVGLVFLITGMITLSWLNQSKADSPVKVVKLESRLFAEQITTSGILGAEKQQAVYFQADRGELKKIWVKSGQKVKAGDRLAEYDSTTLAGEIQQAELQVKTAKIKLNGLYRQRKDLNQSSTSSTKKNQDLNEQIALAKLELQQAEQQLEQSKTKESRLVVKSEIAGTVVMVNKQADKNMTVAEPMVVVADLSQLKVTANISEYDALKVKGGQLVKIKSDAILDQEWSGKVEKIGLFPNSNKSPGTSGQNAQVTYPVVIQVTDSIPVRLGSQLILEIDTFKDKVLSLPQSAVKEQGDQTYVFVVENGKVVRKDVKIGKRDEQDVEIVSGITPEQQVIEKPTTDLVPGVEVKLK